MRTQTIELITQYYAAFNANYYNLPDWTAQVGG